MTRLQPEWIGELLGICAADDWSDVQARLGHPSVSPMFRRLLPEREVEDVVGYSSAEVRACKAGIEWLAHAHPREHAALEWELHRWKRAHLQRQDDHESLLQAAAKLLAGFVDRACE